MPPTREAGTPIRLFAAMGLAACIGLVCLPPRTAEAQVQLPQFISVDVQSVAIDGDFVLDGGAFPVDFGDTGILSLSGAEADEIILGFGADQSYGPLLAIEGSYEPGYRILFSGGGVPINPLTAIGPPFALAASGTLDVEVASVVFTPSFKLNGDPFPGSPQHAEFRLRDATTGEEVPIGTSLSAPAPVRVIPGVYDVVYEYVSGNQIPENRHAVVMQGVAIGGATKLTIDVPCMLHRLDYTIDGVPPPVSQAERGAIALRNFDTGDWVDFDPTPDLVSIRHIVPGTYDVTYSHIQGGNIVPRNTLAVVEAGLSIQPPDVSSPVDVQTILITPDPTLDGSPFFASGLEDGFIVLAGAHGDEVDLGLTSVQPMPAIRLVPGTYDAHYRRQSGGTIAPANPNARIASALDLTTTSTLSIDVESFDFEPTFTLDGQPFVPSPLETGNFRLEGTQPGDVISLGPSHLPITSKRVIAGTYEIVFDWVAGSVAVPRNSDQTVGLVTIGPGMPTAFGFTTRRVQPNVTLDGGAFPANPGHRGDLLLTSAIGGGELDLGSTSDPSAVSIAFAGLYDVRYRWAAGDQVPMNLDRKLDTVLVPEAGTLTGLAAGGLLLAALGSASRPSRRSRHTTARAASRDDQEITAAPVAHARPAS